MDDDLLKIAIKASIEAGVEIMKVYNTDFTHELKEDASPLTIADKKSNAIINSYLTKTAIPIISEENDQVEYTTRKDWQMCWVVDPLDGTKEFIKRNGEFTVNIALVEQGNPVMGVVYVPEKKELYFAKVPEKKAFKIKLDTTNCTAEEIIAEADSIQPNSISAAKIRVVGSRSHMNKETKVFIASLSKDKEVEIVSKGSSLKFCLVAEGKADIYPRYAPTMEWDTAAAHAICNAVGVKVVSLNSNKELAYNKENLLNPWFICK